MSYTMFYGAYQMKELVPSKKAEMFADELFKVRLLSMYGVSTALPATGP